MKIQSKVNGLTIDHLPYASDVTKLGRGKYADTVSAPMPPPPPTAEPTATAKPTPKKRATKADNQPLQEGVIEEL